jgi:phage gpG-like protein
MSLIAYLCYTESVAEDNVEIRGLGEAKKRIEQIDARLADPTRAMDDIGNMLVTSILRNFEVGGRPAWPDLQPATWARKTTTKILIESGRLRDSIGYDLESGGRRLIVGTIQQNVPYAAAHQFGLKGRIEQSVPEHLRRAHTRRTARGVVNVPEHRVRAHTRTINQNIPARPFVVIQDEDIREIEQIVRDFLIGLELRVRQ